MTNLLIKAHDIVRRGARASVDNYMSAADADEFERAAQACIDGESEELDYLLDRQDALEQYRDEASDYEYRPMRGLTGWAREFPDFDDWMEGATP